MTIDIRDLPGRFEEALKTAASGQEVILTDGSVPQARIVPCHAMKPRVEGLNPGAIETGPDFDAPLPDDLWIGQS